MNKEIICKFCGKSIVPTDKRSVFCNQSCSSKYNNKGKRRHGKEPGTCIVCGMPKQRNARKYCSLKCSAADRYRINVDAWLSGKTDGCVGKNKTPAKYIQRYLRETLGEKCQKCRWSTKHSVTGKVPLNLHHSNGDFTDNRISNLMLLCPNCHSLTETYGSLNTTCLGRRRRGCMH